MDDEAPMPAADAIVAALQAEAPVLLCRDGYAIKVSLVAGKVIYEEISPDMMFKPISELEWRTNWAPQPRET